MLSAFDLELDQLHVKSAFLHGNLEEQIYMYQPKGFLDSGKEDYVFVEEIFVWLEIVTKVERYKRFDAFMIFHDYVRNQ